MNEKASQEAEEEQEETRYAGSKFAFLGYCYSATAVILESAATAVGSFIKGV